MKQLIEENYIPFIGMGAFKGSSLPYDSDSFIYAMNDGKPMPQRLMYEYSRAAMNLEQKKGRAYIENLVKSIYSADYPLPQIYETLKQIKPKYVIDVNMDDSLQKIYSDVSHFLILGTARVLGDGNRFIVYRYDVLDGYKEIDQEFLDDSCPILFKPMGSVAPKQSFIVSDADFVDWLTEAMGGYAIPKFLKEYRKNKSYLFYGIDFSKDTYRMVANEITMDLAGGIYISEKENFSKREEKYFANHNLEVRYANS